MNMKLLLVAALLSGNVFAGSSLPNMNECSPETTTAWRDYNLMTDAESSDTLAHEAYKGHKLKQCYFMRNETPVIIGAWCNTDGKKCYAKFNGRLGEFPSRK